MRALLRIGIAGLLASGPDLFAAGPVYHVNSTADALDAALNGVCLTSAGVCTLRAAVMEATSGPNPTAEEVTIELPAGTYTLTRAIGANDDESNGDLNLGGKVKIVGAGFDLSIIDANHIDRAISVGSSATITLQDLRVQNGSPPDVASRHGGAYGGGIYNEGALTLVRCLVRANQIPTVWSGGGIYSASGSSLTLRDSVARINNAPDGWGGGIASLQATVAITRSTVNSNTGTFGGGGLYIQGGTLRVLNSTIAGNVTTYGGGGITLYQVPDAALNNVTVATNTSSADSPSGGGIYVNSSTVFILNSIFSNSSNTGVACTGTSSVYSNGFNILGDVTNCAIDGSYTHLDPLLGTLGFYGGLTATFPLLKGSPAIDAGDDSLFGCADADGNPLSSDQRGVARPLGGRCDIGAFEVEQIGDANGDGAVDVSDVFYLINFLFAGGGVPRGRASVDGVFGTDVNDVFYLINFLFAGGEPPK
jgi:CSLREA domain-containing protein